MILCFYYSNIVAPISIWQADRTQLHLEELQADTTRMHLEEQQRNDQLRELLMDAYRQIQARGT